MCLFNKLYVINIKKYDHLYIHIGRVPALRFMGELYVSLVIGIQGLAHTIPMVIVI